MDTQITNKDGLTNNFLVQIGALVILTVVVIAFGNSTRSGAWSNFAPLNKLGNSASPQSAAPHRAGKGYAFSSPEKKQGQNRLPGLILYDHH